MDFLEVVLDPAHEQHRDMVRWYGGPFDPIGLDEERGAVRHGEHGAPAARPTGQPQELDHGDRNVNRGCLERQGASTGAFSVWVPGAPIRSIDGT